MSLIPEYVSNILKIITDFYNLYSIIFNSVSWDSNRNVLFLRQSNVQPHEIKFINDNYTRILLAELHKIMPTFSYSDIITYHNGDIGIIIRKSTEEEKISDLPIELYVDIAKDLDSKELNVLCVSNKQFKKLCDNNEFWRRLLLLKIGGNPPQGSAYNYRKLYKVLLVLGLNKNELLSHMKTFYGYGGGNPDIWIKDAIFYTDAIIYLFNTDQDFKEKIFNDSNKLFYLLVCLVISGYIEKAKRLTSFIKEESVSDNVKLISILMPVYFKNHDYIIIDFLTNNYPTVFNEKLYIYDEYLSDLPKEDISKFLSNVHITQNHKNNVLLGVAYSHNLTPQEVLEYVKLYRDSIDKEFLLLYLEKILIGSNRIDSLSFMLKYYGNILDSDDITYLVGRLIERYIKKLNDEDISLLYMLLGIDAMKKKYKKINLD